MKTRLTLALLLSPLGSWAQLINDGATLTVGPGATLHVEGAVQNKDGSTLANAGTVQLTGDLTNAGTLSSLGVLLFSGTTNQVFLPGRASVTALTLDNAGPVGQRTLSIPADLAVSGTLTLLNGLVRTAPVGASTPLATLTLLQGAGVSGEMAGRYVQGNLRVKRPAVNAGTGPVDFTNGFVLDPQGQDLGTVDVTRTAGLNTAGLSHAQNLPGAARGIDRIWTVESSQSAFPSAATPAVVTLHWVSDDDNGFDPAVAAQLWRAPTAAGPWVAEGSPNAASSRSFTAPLAQLGTLTVSNRSVPLPVELTRFTAQAQGADALLQWATASELNNDRFEVEASADGLRFTRIGQVAGQGSSTRPQQYQLVDPGIARYAADPVYYRLRQVDRDGSFHYSPVRAVRVQGAAGFAVQLYPNPSRRDEALSLLVHTPEAGPLRWELFDALGRSLVGQTAPVLQGTNKLPINALANLATGVYLMRVQQGAHQQAIKLVLE